MVDPGVGTARGALAFTAKGHGFVGPDNGVFSAVLHGTEVEAVSLPLPEAASATFHGRDVFARGSGAWLEVNQSRLWVSPTAGFRSGCRARTRNTRARV